MILKNRLQQLQPEIEFTLEFACKMKWENMQETNVPHCKHCEACDQNIFDLVDLGPNEICDLIERNAGEICGQAFIRNDNRLAFKECKKPPTLMRGKIKPSFQDG